HQPARSSAVRKKGGEGTYGVLVRQDLVGLGRRVGLLRLRLGLVAGVSHRLYSQETKKEPPSAFSCHSSTKKHTESHVKTYMLHLDKVHRVFAVAAHAVGAHAPVVVVAVRLGLVAAILLVLLVL